MGDGSRDRLAEDGQLRANILGHLGRATRRASPKEDGSGAKMVKFARASWASSVAALMEPASRTKMREAA